MLKQLQLGVVKGLLTITFLFTAVITCWGQTNIFSHSGGGALPAGWSHIEGSGTTSFYHGSFWMLEAHTTVDTLTTASYDLSAYGTAEFLIDIKSYGNGEHAALEVDISYDGGLTYSQTSLTNHSTHSYVTQTITLNQVSDAVKLKIAPHEPDRNGVRIQNLILKAYGTAPCSYTLPFTEDFENTTFPPVCWDSFIGSNGLGTVHNWHRTTSNTYNSSSGTAYVQYEDVIGGNAEDWLVTPPIIIPNTLGSIELEFYEKQSYSVDYGTQYYVKIATENPTDHASYTTVASYDESSFSHSSYNERVVDLTAYEGQTIYIAFVMVENDGDDWYIDDISVTEDCFDPYTLPFTEDFEEPIFTPLCWKNFIGANGIGNFHNWERVTSNTYNSSAGTAYVQYETVSGGNAEDWLVTPAIEFPNTVGIIELKFHEKQSYGINYGTQYYVKVATENPTDHASYTTVASYDESSFSHTSYSERTVDLTTYQGQTVYIAFVMVENDGDDWYIDDISITESCGAYSLPFTEGFEDATFPPTCWDSFIGTNGLGTVNNWQRITSYTYNSSAGTAFVQYEAVSGGNAEDWLVSPAIKCPVTTGTIQLSYQESQAYGFDYGSQYFIKVATENPTDPASYTTVVNYDEGTFSNYYSERVVDLTAYEGQTIYIAFVMIENDGDDWFIDDVTVAEVIPEFGAPVATNATDISIIGFTANWNTVSDVVSYRLDVSTTSDFSSYISGYENLDVGDVTSYEVTGLTSATDYYYRVRAVSASETSSSSNVITLTTGIEDVWNGTEWTAGSPPTGIDAAIIEGAYNTGVNGTFTAATLIINAGGSVVIASGDNLTITGEVVNNEAPSAFVIESNGNLIQVDDIANTGGIQLQKHSSPLYRLDYSAWSSPVVGQNLLNFSPETLTNRFYVYNEGTDLYNSIAPGSNTFQPGYGYLIRMPNNHVDFVQESAPGEVWTGTFEGPPNNGTVTVNLSTSLNGFNLVGNPYPSPINVEAFYDANSSTLALGSALYFWRKRNNPDATTYCTITRAAYTANSAAGGDTGTWFNGVGTSNWIINSGQGFFVRASGSTLVFNNAMRSPINNEQFFRYTKELQSESSGIWLNMSTETKYSQMAIVYKEGMTLGIDYGWDGKALVADGPVTVFTIADEENLAIQARPMFEETDRVAVGIYAKDAGNYTISLDRVKGLFEEGQQVYLNDHLLDTTYNLTEGDYNFSTEAGIFYDRFEVIYTITGALNNNNPIVTNNEVVVYKEGNSIMIDAGSAEMNTVNVYDINGRLLYSVNDINATTTAINNLQIEQQLIILEINTNKGSVNKKFVF